MKAHQQPTNVHSYQSWVRLGPPVKAVFASPDLDGRFGTLAPTAQPLEPILFPKLRIYFADFPYLHCSIDQRLLTLETCCGYEYEQT